MQMQERAYCAEDVVAFLRLLLRKIPGKLLVIWDGAPIHVDKAIPNASRKEGSMSELSALLVAICLFVSSGCLVLALTLVQIKDVPIAIQLLTLAVLPGPLLFMCMGLVAWVFTHSLLWAIGLGMASYILAMATALQVQKIIVNLWNRIKRITT